MTFWKLHAGAGADNGGYVNGALAGAVLTLRVNPTEWWLTVGGLRLVGSYASQADAEEAARKVTQGIDPSTLV
jgi:predicted S18 family serine protease